MQMIDGRIKEPKSDKQPALGLNTQKQESLSQQWISYSMLDIMHSICVTINAMIYNKSL